jgi:hypothetical protein
VTCTELKGLCGGAGHHVRLRETDARESESMMIAASERTIGFSQLGAERERRGGN